MTSERNPVDWAVLPLRRYVQGGRSCRAEFWWFMLFVTLVDNALTVMTEGIGWYDRDPVGFVDVIGGWGSVIFAAATIVPQLTVTIRRLHGTERSAKWLLFIFVPVLGWLALFVVLVMEGTRDRNRFGPDPLAPPKVDPSIFA